MLIEIVSTEPGEAMAIRTRSLIVALALVLAGCGAAPTNDTVDGHAVVDPTPSSTSDATPSSTIDAERSSNTPAQAPATITEHLAEIQAAMERTGDMPTGRVSGSIEVASLDPSQPFDTIVMPFHGAYNHTSGDYSFYMDTTGWEAVAAGDEDPTELAVLYGETEYRQVGDRLYFTDPYWTATYDAETAWISQPADGSIAAIWLPMTSPPYPRELFETWSIVTLIVDAGLVAAIETSRESLNGVPATRYRIVLDNEKLFGHRSAEELAELEAKGADLEAPVVPFEVWISDDGLIIRFVAETGDPSGAQGVDYQLTRFDLFDLGVQIAIEPPPAHDVTAIEDVEGAGFIEIGEVVETAP